MAADNRLAAFRGAERLTRADLAEFVGEDVKVIRDWEAGRAEIPFHVATRLGRRFGVRVDYLLGTEMSDADALILLVESLPPGDRDALRECWAAVGDALAVLPDDRRSRLVRDLRGAREQLGQYFAVEHDESGA